MCIKITERKEIMGNRFNKEAKKIAAGQPTQKLKKKKSGKLLEIRDQTNTREGEISRSGGQLINIEGAPKPRREEGQGGGAGRRR
jgi:hypothetical protein